MREGIKTHTTTSKGIHAKPDRDEMRMGEKPEGEVVQKNRDITIVEERW